MGKTPRRSTSAKSVALAMILMLHAFTPAEPQLGAVTLGVVLDRLMQKVDAIVANAANAGNGVVITAGAEVYIALQNAKLAYEESLSKTMDAVDQTTRDVFGRLDGLVVSLEKPMENANQIVERSQQLVLTMPFSRVEPQVRATTPRYVVPGASEDVKIQIEGLFFFAARERFQPILTIGNKEFAPESNTTNQLGFLVPLRELADASKPQGWSYARLVLRVPYKTGSLFGRRREANYKLLVGRLPATLGSLTFACQSFDNVTETQPVRWPQQGSISQHSHSEDIPENPQTNLKLYPAEPPPEGWQIERSRIRFVVDGPRNGSFEGRVKTPGSQANAWEVRWALVEAVPRVTYGVATVKRRFGESGKIDFHFEYDVRRTIKKERLPWPSQSLSLRWGDTVSQPCPHKWNLKFESAVDGSTATINTPRDLKFIRVSEAGGAVTVTAADARNLRWP